MNEPPAVPASAPNAPLGKTDSIPRVIVGTWQLSTGHRVRPRPEAEVFDVLARAADRGFSAVDCADIYTGVEELLGRFRGWYRDRSGAEAAGRLRFHTKLVPDRDSLARVDRQWVERTVDRSLSRLGVDRLDAVQFAWWDYKVPGYVELGGWLNDLRKAGKVRHVAATNFDTTRLREILDAGVPVAAHQVQYSILDRRAAAEMTALCREHDIALLGYGTLAGGLLTDRYQGQPAPEEPYATRSLRKYMLIADEFGGWEALQGLLAAMQGVAERRAATLAQVAVAYVLAQPQVGAAIVGLSGWPRVREALEGAGLVLDSADLAQLDAAVDSAPGPAGPVFGLERIPGARHARIMKYNLNREGESGSAPTVG